MHNAFAVGGLERLQNLSGVQQCASQRQGPVQRLALHELHHQVIRTDVVQGRDVRVVQRGCGASFTREAIAELSMGNLQGDDAVQAAVAGLEDLAHSALADRRDHLVWTEISGWFV